jgi:hypothetical protein
MIDLSLPVTIALMSSSDQYFDQILQVPRSGGAITSRMLDLISYCERMHPHPDWAKMRQIDFEADSETLSAWLPRWTQSADPSENFKGLWFGLFNPILPATDEPTAELYVAAGPEFDAGSSDWASHVTFVTAHSHLNSRVLHSIYKLAYAEESGLGNDAEHPLALAYGLAVSRRALESIVFTGPFAALEGAGGGFDSGDLVILGSFEAGRFACRI